MILLILSFVAGVLTALAPCVLPMIPLVIGGSISGDNNKSRAYIVTGSLALSLFCFTLLLKASSVLINVDTSVWANISGSIVIMLGFLAVFPEIWEHISSKLGLQARSQKILGKGVQKKGLIGSILTGAALGPVFSSCSPTYAFILFTILPRSTVSGVFYLAVYCLGLVSVMLVISIFGQKTLSKHAWAINPHSTLRRLLGILFILVGLAVITNWDKKIETFLVDNVPFNITSIDQRIIDANKDNLD